MQKERENLIASHLYFFDAERKRKSYCFTLIFSRRRKKEKILLLHSDIFSMRNERKISFCFTSIQYGILEFAELGDVTAGTLFKGTVQRDFNSVF
jgi:hypothetical protein